MTASVILADFKGKSRKYTKMETADYHLAVMEAQGLAIINEAFPSVFGYGDGIDSVYLAPEKDPA